MQRPFGACVLGLAFVATAASGGMQWGGYVPEGQERQFRVNLGGIFEFEGMVEETKRKYYDAVGRQISQGDAEHYDSNDFNVDDFYGMIGLSWNRNWQGCRLQLDTSFLNPQIDTKASRDYWLTVQDDISYGGANYDHMMIPSGSPFSMDLLGNVTELTLSLVPFGFQDDDGLTLTPMIDVGLLGAVGWYEIDAGEARGVREYQNPPEQFVVGGFSKGIMGAALPQVGVGINFLAGDPDGLQLELDAHYLMMTYNGSSEFFTTAKHRKKKLDLDHQNIRFRGGLGFPCGKTRMIAGVQVELIDLEGTVESSATSRKDVIGQRERFDKEFSFTLHSVVATLGFVF